MGFPISPVIGNIFIKHFGKEILKIVLKKLKKSLVPLNDTFVIWRHGKIELRTTDVRYRVNKRSFTTKLPIDVVIDVYNFDVNRTIINYYVYRQSDFTPKL